MRAPSWKRILLLLAISTLIALASAITFSSQQNRSSERASAAREALSAISQAQDSYYQRHRRWAHRLELLDVDRALSRAEAKGVDLDFQTGAGLGSWWASAGYSLGTPLSGETEFESFTVVQPLAGKLVLSCRASSARACRDGFWSLEG